MFIDADDIEERSNQTVYVPELHLAPFSLTQGDPIEYAARGGKIHANEAAARHDNATTIVS